MKVMYDLHKNEVDILNEQLREVKAKLQPSPCPNRCRMADWVMPEAQAPDGSMQPYGDYYCLACQRRGSGANGGENAI